MVAARGAHVALLRLLARVLAAAGAAGDGDGAVVATAVAGADALARFV